jgi:hypothetical protein
MCIKLEVLSSFKKKNYGVFPKVSIHVCDCDIPRYMKFLRWVSLATG